MFIRIFVVLTFASIFLSFGAVNSTSFLSTAQTNVFEDSPQRATLFRKDKDSAASDRKDNVKLNGDLELDVNEKQKDGNNLINYGDGLSSITNLPNGNDVISKYNVMPTEDDVPFIDSEPLESITSKGDFDSDDDTTPNDVGDVSTKVDDYHYPTQLLLDEASLEDDDIHNDEDILDVDDITDRDDIALTNNDVSSIDSIPLDGAASERDLVLCDDNASTNEYAATTPVDDESTDDVEHQDNSLHIDDEADDSQPDSNKSLTDDAMSEHDDDLTEDTISGADEIPAGENTHADVNLYIHDDIHNDEDTLDVDEITGKYDIPLTNNNVSSINSISFDDITSERDSGLNDDTASTDEYAVTTPVDDESTDDAEHQDNSSLVVDKVDEIRPEIDGTQIEDAALEDETDSLDDVTLNDDDYDVTTPVDNHFVNDITYQDNSLLHIDGDDNLRDNNKFSTDDAMLEDDADLTEDTISEVDEIPFDKNVQKDFNLFILDVPLDNSIPTENVTCKVVDINSDDIEGTNEIDEVETERTIEPNEAIACHTDSLLLIDNASDEDDIHNDEDTLDVNDITDKDYIPLTNYDMPSIDSISFDDITSERDSGLSGDTASTDEYAVTRPLDDESTDDVEHQDKSLLVAEKVDDIRPEVDGTQIEDAALEDETNSLDDVTLNDDGYDVTTPVDDHSINAITYQDNSLHVEDEGDDNQLDNNKLPADDAMSEDDADLTEDIISGMDEIPVGENIHENVNLLIHDVPLDNSIPTGNVTCKVVDINSDDIEGTNEIDEIETERTIKPSETIACHTDNLLLIDNASDENDDINNDVDTLDVEDITDKDDMSSIVSVPFDDITSERDSILSGDTASTDVYDVTRPVDDESTDDVQHHVNLLHIDDEGDDNQPEDNKLPTDDTMFEDDVDLTKDTISGMDQIPAGENTHENVNFFIHDVQLENSIPTENVTCKVVDINSDDIERTNEIDEVETGGNIEPNETITRHTDSLLLIGNASDEDDEIHNDEDTLDVDDNTDKDDNPSADDDMSSIDSITLDDVASDRDSILSDDIASNDDDYDVTRPVDDESTDDVEHQDKSLLVAEKVDDVTDKDDIALTNNDVSSIDSIPLDGVASERDLVLCDDNASTDEYAATTPLDDESTDDVEHQDKSLLVAEKVDDIRPEVDGTQIEDAALEDETNSLDDVTLNDNDYDVTTPVDDHSINDITYQDNSLHVEDEGDDNQPDTNIFSTDDVMSAYDAGLNEDSKIDISVLKNLTLAATSAIYSITKTYPTQTAKRTKPADDIIIDDELSSEAGDPYIDDYLSKYYAMPTNGIKTESVSLLPDYIMSQVNPLTTDDNIPETEISFIDEVSSENAVVPSDFIPTNDVTTADYVLLAEYTISEADDVISDQFSFKDGEIIKQLNKDEGLRMSVNDAVGKDDNTKEDALQKHQLLTSQFKEEERGENMDESTSDHEDLIDVENGNNSIEISSITEENEPEINNVNLLTPPNNIKQESLENIDRCQEDDDTCEVALAPFGDNAYTEDKENFVSLYKNYVPSLTTLKYFFEIES